MSLESDASQLRKLPPELAEALIHRGEWSLCAMEHSRIGAIEFEAPGAPFHHLALPMERVPLRFGLKMDGRRQVSRNAPDTLTMIEAGVGGTTMWDGSFESACLYFTSDALSVALGCDLAADDHSVRTRVALHSPLMARLVNALQADAADRQPHGSLVGDAIFVVLASLLVPKGEHRRKVRRDRGEQPRVAQALEYIHANLTSPIGIAEIASAAATSPFYLAHTFRSTVGLPIWKYVLRERARYARALMTDLRFNLADLSQMSGFETYASFITAIRREYGTTPAMLRRALLI